jgi:hypothetical protein
VQSSNRHHQTLLMQARGKATACDWSPSYLGSFRNVEKVGLPNLISINTFILSEMPKKVIVDLLSKSQSIYPVAVFSTSQTSPGRLTCAMLGFFLSAYRQIRTAACGRIENSGNTCPTRAGEKRQITRPEQWRRLRLISQLVETFPLS